MLVEWAETSVASGVVGAGAADGVGEIATQANGHQQGLTTTPVNAAQPALRATSAPLRKHISPLKQRRGVKRATDADLSFSYFEWRPARRPSRNRQL
jgi:hypothetical protein